MLIRRSAAVPAALVAAPFVAALFVAALFVAGCGRGAAGPASTGTPGPTGSIPPGAIGSIPPGAIGSIPPGAIGSVPPGAVGSPPTRQHTTVKPPTAAGRQTLSGTVTAGVEPHCLLLTGDGAAHLLLFTDPAQRAKAQVGTSITVVGTAAPTQLTTCQQGIPFVVTSVTVE
jgi:hypothetical protein